MKDIKIHRDYFTNKKVRIEQIDYKNVYRFFMGFGNDGRINIIGSRKNVNNGIEIIFQY